MWRMVVTLVLAMPLSARAAGAPLLDPAGAPHGSAAVTLTKGSVKMKITGLPQLPATAPTAPGILVLADACFPGWTATIDGRPAPILCANVLTRAVEVPPGDHVIRFEYQAPGFLAGVAATAGALALCALLLAGSRPPGPP